MCIVCFVRRLACKKIGEEYEDGTQGHKVTAIVPCDVFRQGLTATQVLCISAACNAQSTQHIEATLFDHMTFWARANVMMKDQKKDMLQMGHSLACTNLGSLITASDSYSTAFNVYRVAKKFGRETADEHGIVTNDALEFLLLDGSRPKPQITLHMLANSFHITHAIPKNGYVPGCMRFVLERIAHINAKAGKGTGVCDRWIANHGKDIIATILAAYHQKLLADGQFIATASQAAAEFVCVPLVRVPIMLSRCILSTG
jgi:hypothetical protein